MTNSHALDIRFEALAHPLRRRIVERLVGGPATVGQASRGLRVSKPTISRHLRVLEAARLITRRIEGREHNLSLNAEALAEVSSWIDTQHARWEQRLDLLDDYLATKKEIQ